MAVKNLKRQLFNGTPIPDPGASGTIYVKGSPEFCQLTSLTAETRTLAVPTRAGAEITISMKVDGGDITLTVTSGYNEDGDTTFVFSDPGQFLKLESVYDGTNYFWRKIADHQTGNVSLAELGYINGVTAGTAAASKALVTDANNAVGNLTSFSIGAAVPTNPQSLFSPLPPVNAAGVTANQSYYHANMTPGAATTVPAGTAPVVATLNLAEPNITATGTVTAAATLRIVDAPTEGTTNWAFWVDAGATRLDGTAYIGDTSNATVTLGLTINQGAADDSILEFKSSDITHATTTVTEADTYALFMKHHATAGGLRCTGIATGAVIAQQIRGIGTEDTTDAPTTSSLATLNLNGYIISTNTVTGHGATGNLLNVQSNSVNEFIVKGDGELYSNQSATVGTFDAHDDALMCADLSYVLSREYAKVINHGRDLFEKLGILGPLDERGQGMYSVTKMLMLSICAIGQLGRQMGAVAEKLGLKLTNDGADLLE